MRSSSIVGRYAPAAAALAVLVAIAGQAAADARSNMTVRGVGTGFNGNGVTVGVIEAALGNPQLAPANPNMPQAGPAAGQAGRTTILANAFNTSAPVVTDHATSVVGTIQGGAGIAASTTLFETASGNNFDMIQMGQRMFTPVANGGNGVQIMNLSLSFNDPPANANSHHTKWADWSAITSAQTQPYRDKLVVIAGNENAANTRYSPWDNYNGITVAAMRGNASHTLATYNGGPGTQNFTSNGRFKTDISAPGGADGVALRAPVRVGSALDNFGGTNPNDGLNDDQHSWGGTSFAAPHVAGAAAQIYQANGGSIDHKAAKALLLNGASTRFENHWNVARAGGAAWRPEGNQGNKGAQQIYVGWDGDIGTGMLDVQNSIDNWRGGNQNAGNVSLVGWNVGFMNATGQTRDYVLTPPNPADGVMKVTCTMCWDRRVELTTDANADGFWQPGDAFTGQAFNDFDLEIWDLTLNQRLFFSTSDRDSIEHIRDFTIPVAERLNQIAIRTRDFAHNDAGIIQYGLAWFATPIPTPAGLAVLGFGLFAMRRRRG